MSVDADLYIGAHVNPEMIASAVARAIGVSIDNPFTGGRLIKSPLQSMPAFFTLDVYPTLRLYFSPEGPLGPCWVLSGGSRADVIGIMTAVATAFGGVLVYDDVTDNARVFRRPEAGSELFDALNNNFREIQKVDDFSEYQKHAVYDMPESKPEVFGALYTS